MALSKLRLPLTDGWIGHRSDVKCRTYYEVFQLQFYQFESGRPSGVDLGLAVNELEQPDGRVDCCVVVGSEGRGLGYHGRTQNQGLADPVK